MISCKKVAISILDLSCFFFNSSWMLEICDGCTFWSLSSKVEGSMLGNSLSANGRRNSRKGTTKKIANGIKRNKSEDVLSNYLVNESCITHLSSFSPCQLMPLGHFPRQFGRNTDFSRKQLWAVPVMHQCFFNHLFEWSLDDLDFLLRLFRVVLLFFEDLCSLFYNGRCVFLWAWWPFTTSHEESVDHHWRVADSKWILGAVEEGHLRLCKHISDQERSRTMRAGEKRHFNLLFSEVAEASEIFYQLWLTTCDNMPLIALYSSLADPSSLFKTHCAWRCHQSCDSDCSSA